MLGKEPEVDAASEDADGLRAESPDHDGEDEASVERARQANESRMKETGSEEVFARIFIASLNTGLKGVEEMARTLARRHGLALPQHDAFSKHG